MNALPKKGRLSSAETAREAEPAVAAARRKHSGVESAINNNLEHSGLDRVRLRGPEGFEPAVGLSVLAPDFHRLGMILRDKERKRMQRKREPLHSCQRLCAA